MAKRPNRTSRAKPGSKTRRKAKPRLKRKQKRARKAAVTKRQSQSRRPIKRSVETIAGSSAQARSVERGKASVGIALQDLGKAVRQLELSGHALLKSIADLQDEATVVHQSKLIRALVADQVLQDLSDARVAFEGTPEEQVPESLRPFTLLPQAIAEWIEGHLGLRPCARRGQELEIPSERLSEFSVDGDVPQLLPPLVRIRIIAQGWQSATETLVKPSVVLVADSPTAGRE